MSLLQPLITNPASSASSASSFDHPPRSLSSSSSTVTLNAFDLRLNNAELPQQIASIFQNRVIPEAEALDREAEIDSEVVFGTRRLIARVLMDIIRLDTENAGPKSMNPRDDVFGSVSSRKGEEQIKQLVGWAVGTLAGWYRAGSALPWRAVLDKTLHQVVSALPL